MTEIDTERTRTFEWDDPMAALAAAEGLGGLEIVLGVADGTLPAPPIARMLGMDIVEADEGRAVFSLEPAEWMYNPIGSVHGGIAAALLDSCMGCAVHTLLPAGRGYTTTDLQVRYARGMSADTGRVLATGEVVHAGRRVVTAEGRIVVEATGKLIAHGSTACVLL